MSYASRLQFIPNFFAWLFCGQTFLPAFASGASYCAKPDGFAISFRDELRCSARYGFDISPLPQPGGMLSCIRQHLACWQGYGLCTEGTDYADKAGSGVGYTLIAARDDGPLTEEGRFTH